MSILRALADNATELAAALSVSIAFVALVFSWRTYVLNKKTLEAQLNPPKSDVDVIVVSEKRYDVIVLGVPLTQQRVAEVLLPIVMHNTATTPATGVSLVVRMPKTLAYDNQFDGLDIDSDWARQHLKTTSANTDKMTQLVIELDKLHATRPVHLNIPLTIGSATETQQVVQARTKDDVDVALAMTLLFAYSIDINWVADDMSAQHRHLSLHVADTSEQSLAQTIARWNSLRKEKRALGSLAGSKRVICINLSTEASQPVADGVDRFKVEDALASEGLYFPDVGKFFVPALNAGA